MSKGRGIAVLVIATSALAAVWSSWNELSKLDLAKIPTRASWQLPARVVDALGVSAGDRVADIGAGDGYFTFLLAGAVGAAGRVYAVEIDEHLVANLERQVQIRDVANVDVVLGELDDPRLPDRALDLVFLCNTYHHIDQRPEYFSRLRSDLAPGGRVAIVDMRADVTGLARLFVDAGHWMPRPELYGEMELGGYRPHRRFDFLPMQIFEVFTAAE